MGEVVSLVLPLLETFEGLFLRPYLCPAKVPSIGLGSTRYEDGRAVRLTDPEIGHDRAYSLASLQLRAQYIPAVLKLCPGIDSARRLAAIVDFTYNLGEGNLRSSTLRKRINAGRWGDVPYELRKWKYAGGAVQLGLERRREAEARMCP